MNLAVSQWNKHVTVFMRGHIFAFLLLLAAPTISTNKQKEVNTHMLDPRLTHSIVWLEYRERYVNLNGPGTAVIGEKKFFPFARLIVQ